MTDPRSGAAWLREPLLHFLLVGAALFLLFHFLSGGRSEAPREIVVGEARVEALAENFAKTWMRPPTAQELKGLADDYVAEEVYYREAIAMGLDRDDTVIRRRLRQKMEFISEDLASAVQPTDAQLQEYLERHADKFVRASRLTFQQVFFSGEKRGQDASRDAERLLAELQAGRGPANPLDAGDPTLLPAVHGVGVAAGDLEHLWQRVRGEGRGGARRTVGWPVRVGLRRAHRAGGPARSRRDADARRDPSARRA